MQTSQNRYDLLEGQNIRNILSDSQHLFGIFITHNIPANHIAESDFEEGRARGREEREVE
jgi:hypothetical protein